MLATAIKQAIVRIEVFDASAPNKAMFLGTGFLVEPDLVLTAAHVLRAPNLSRIEVHFEGSAFPLVATVHPGSQAAKSDWALLKCTPPAGAAAPVRLERLERLLLHSYEVRWESFGWPRLYRQLGGHVHGEVRFAGTKEIDTEVRELSGQPASQAEGLSGAPCVVHGAAIGLVLAVVDVAGNAPGATLKVLPAQTIVEESNGLLQLRDDTPLPYQDYFQTLLELQGLAALSKLARVLMIEGVDALDNVPKNVLARRLARAMIMGGVQATVAVVKALDVALPAIHAEALMDLAETTWVNESAAKQLAQIANRTTPKAFAINTQSDKIGRDYVQRANDAHAPILAPIWGKQCVVVIPSKQEPLPASLYDAVLFELKNQLNWTDWPEAEVLEALSADGPFTALIVGNTTQEALAEVGRKLKDLHLVLLSHPYRSPEFAQIFPNTNYVEPELEAGDELLADKARKRTKVERTRRGIWKGK